MDENIMAAIDKLYVHSYYEYDMLRRWAIAYCPELLFYFYDITETYQQWEDNCRYWVKNNLKIAKQDYKRLGKFKDKNDAISQLIQRCAKDGIEMSFSNAKTSIDYILSAYEKTAEDWEKLYTHPVMNTPLWMDKKLKWICPVPSVREYLHKQCGVSSKWEWFYKLFWKGVKHFYIKNYFE